MGMRSAAFLSWVSDLVHAHRGRLAAVARREGLAGEDALDCVQEAFRSFLVLPQARLLGGIPDDAAKILTVLTRNLARNLRRRHHRARVHLREEALAVQAAGGPMPDELVAAAESHAAALGCMETLARIQQRVVTLRILDDVPGENVARRLGLTPGHVAVLLHRAVDALRTCMIEAGHVSDTGRRGGTSAPYRRSR